MGPVGVPRERRMNVRCAPPRARILRARDEQAPIAYSGVSDGEQRRLCTSGRHPICASLMIAFSGRATAEPSRDPRSIEPLGVILGERRATSARLGSSENLDGASISDAELLVVCPPTRQEVTQDHEKHRSHSSALGDGRGIRGMRW